MNSLKFVFAALLAITFCLPALAVDSPQFGKATYYSNKFQGKKTASGERYDKAKMTCAHKTLKFGTIIRVTRIDDPNSFVEVRVNDRGPFRQGYVVDLSYVAAEKIKLIKPGKLNVKVEVIEPAVEPRPVEKPKEELVKPVEASTPTDVKARGGAVKTAKPVEASYVVPMMPDLVGKTGDAATEKVTDSPEKSVAKTVVNKPDVEPALYQASLKSVLPKGYAVQLASLNTPESALSETARLQTIWGDKMLLRTVVDPKGETAYKVLLGPFETQKEALVKQKAAAKKGHPKCFVVNLAE